MSSSARSRLLLAYDAECGPCRSFKRLVSLLEHPGEVAYLSLQDADHDGLLDSVPEELRYSSAHVILSDGVVLSGADALPKLFEKLPAGRFTSMLVARWSPGKMLTRLFYRAAVRIHDADSCRKN